MRTAWCTQAWRQQLRGWLALLGGLKGAKGLHRWREVQRAVALQLSDMDSGVQQAAIKSMKVRQICLNMVFGLCSCPLCPTLSWPKGPR